MIRNQPSICIIIVNWNSGYYLRNCLESIVASDKRSPDIENRNLKSFLIRTALATSFHYSAIIVLFTFYFFLFLSVLAFRISEFFGVALIFFLPDLISIVREKLFMSFIVILYSILMLFNYIFVQKLFHF
jgi:hypothetical protein